MGSRPLGRKEILCGSLDLARRLWSCGNLLGFADHVAVEPSLRCGDLGFFGKHLVVKRRRRSRRALIEQKRDGSGTAHAAFGTALHSVNDVAEPVVLKQRDDADEVLAGGIAVALNQAPQ